MNFKGKGRSKTCENIKTKESNAEQANFFEGLNNDFRDNLHTTEIFTDFKAKPIQIKKLQSINSKNFDFIKWNSLGLCKELIKSVQEIGFTEPTQIQTMCIPAINSGKDVLGSSITGTGKTAAFLLPIMNILTKSRSSGFIKVLIVIPTRELAIQCFEMFKVFNKYTRLRCSFIIGKVPIEKQESELRHNPDIVIATPGRLVDLSKNSKGIYFEEVEYLVFDEADKLLDMGFKYEIEEILNICSSSRKQTLLFSATLGKEIEGIVKLALKNPIRIQADPLNKMAIKLNQEIVKLKTIKSESVREAILIYLLRTVCTESTIVFFKTKRECHRVNVLLDLIGLKSVELHGDLNQPQRSQAVKDFVGDKCILLATDLASRGLDFDKVKFVINFELPYDLERYIHRVGRTARAGNEGTCITLLNDEELKDFKKMMKKTKEKVKSRKLDFTKVKEVHGEVKSLEPMIFKRYKEERYYQELEKAELEAKRLENIIDFEDEIMNKPKREWIVSKFQKNRLLEDDKKRFKRVK